MRVLKIGFLGLVAAGPAWAAGFDPLDAFAPLTLPSPPGVTRSAGGRPGAGYWQNRADYGIEATIDPASHALIASETITYTNNSPDALDVLWLQLDQNIYRPDARAAFMPRYEPYKPGQSSGGYALKSISIEDGGRPYMRSGACHRYAAAASPCPWTACPWRQTAHPYCLQLHGFRAPGVAALP